MFRVLISKVLNSRGLNYAVAVNATSVTLQYLIVGASDVTFLTISSLQLDQKYWQHISVTVFAEDVAFYVNGSLVGASSLERPILDELNGDIKLGVAREGKDHHRHLDPANSVVTAAVLIFRYNVSRSDARRELLLAGSDSKVRPCPHYQQ